MKFNKYLNELASIYGKGITFIDIDETIFNTFAKIYVMKNGKIIKKLSNQEFNTYELQDGESYDFREFRDAAMFRKTSKPIPNTIKRIKRMFQNIDRRGSQVVLLTARNTFPDMATFKKTFKDHGIPVGNMGIEFAGDIQSSTGSVAAAKKKIIMKYLNTGEYRRVRLVDDDLKNVKFFLSIEHDLPKSTIDRVKKKHNIVSQESIPPIQFFGLLVKDDGSLKRLK
jgi:hypothetical protein